MGPPGPTSLVSMTTAAGPVSPGDLPRSVECNGQAGMAFFGATTSVNLSANQGISASATADLGGASVPLSSLSLNVCYQGTAGAISALTDTDYLFNLSLPAGSLAPVTVAKAFSGLPPDAYTIGLCGCVTWDGVSLPAPDPATDWSWLTVQVFQQ